MGPPPGRERKVFMRSAPARVVVLSLFLVLLSSMVLAQVAGQNIDMVSGTSFPGGYPFLQRQNEPSIAVSTRNPSHLLAGANDYRTVDLAIALAAADPDSKVTGDAWLGVFKSFDNGRTWRSTLLPGCRYAIPECQGSPVTSSNYEAGADPLVRAGSNGMFYYSAIAFDRNRNRGVYFVSRFIDDNNREGYRDDLKSNNDTIRYLGAAVVDQGNPGQFLDKPWIAVDIPRAGASTCSIPASGNGPAQSFPGGHVYAAYSRFTGGGNSSQIYLTASTDCGVTWSRPVRVNEGNAKVQGASIAIDPASGAVYVAWRRFQRDAGQVDSIQIVKSTDGGGSFSHPVTISNILPFDLTGTAYGFRNLSFPSIAVDADGRVYAAWSARQTFYGDARVMLSVSADGSSWPAPQIVETPQPLNDMSQMFPVLIQPGLGHQIMPSISIANGKVAILYYSLYEDATAGTLLCPPGSLCNSITQRLGYRQPARKQSAR